MKKYSVKNLYVIEIKYGNEVKLFICSKKNKGDSYNEILTNQKIENKEIASIKPLKDYEPNLDFVSESEILRKYIVINVEASLKNGEVKQKNIDFNEILDASTLKFFPKKGNWYSNCFEKSDKLDMLNLPCHLRDDEWLARMLKNNQNLYYISDEKILEYVKTSHFFDLKRCEYEQEIVKWQIEWMKNDGENWIVDDNYGGDLVFLNPLCDLGFRKGIVDTLTAIGLNLDAIEEGIEKNAPLWRDYLMKMAFYNTYSPVFYDVFRNPDERLKEPSKEFEEKWIKLRKYDYYKSHQKSIEKYGAIEPCMKMSDEELQNLQEYINDEHEKRIKLLNESKGEDSVKKYIKE